MSKEDTPRRIGDYEILGALGKGAMGQVYKAVQPSLNRIVALKVLPPEFSKDEKKVERFSREAKAVALLNHPNIVQIIDKAKDEETFYFVMEYVQGSSLDQVLRRRRLSLQESLSVFKGICKGLEAAHGQNIVHRDLNPRNVLVSEDLSLVKLADFGISRVESISREMGTLSTKEMSMGSLHYMAPEQAVDMLSTDHRADIYSAGVVLYEMLTGRVPVGRFSLPSQLNSEVPPEVDPIVLKCLASDPGDRYASMDQLLKALSVAEDQLRLGLVSELRGISRSTSRIFKRSTETFSGGRKMAIIAAVVVALLAAAAGGYYFLVAKPGQDAGSDIANVAETPRFIPPDSPPAPPAIEDDQTASQNEDPADSADDEPTTAAQPVVQPTAVPQPQDPAPRQAPRPTAVPARPTPRPQPTAVPQTTQRGNSKADQERDLRVARDKLEAGLEQPALTDLERFVDRNPGSPLLGEAYQMITQANLRLGRHDQAMASLVEFQSLYGQDPKAAEALYKLGHLTLDSSGKDRDLDARRIFADVANNYPNSPWAPRALSAKGGIEANRGMQANDRTLGKVPAALITYRQLTNEYPTNGASEGALWELGQMYDDLRKYDLAARAYTDLGSRFQSTKLDAWWEAGQIFERRLNDDTSALAAYRRVPVTSENFKTAQRRIKKLS